MYYSELPLWLTKELESRRSPCADEYEEGVVQCYEIMKEYHNRDKAGIMKSRREMRREIDYLKNIIEGAKNE